MTWRRSRTIQGQYKLEPLSAFLGEEAPAASARPDFPEWDEGAQFDERFFAYLDFVMDLLGNRGRERRRCGRTWRSSASDRVWTFRLDALPAEQAGAEGRGERRVRRDRGLHCQ
jgi:hypothetical protein